LQAWLRLLDMGLTPTMSREMARFTGGSHTVGSIRDLLRSIEAVVLTSVGSYIVAFDTVIEYLPDNHLPNNSNPSVAEARMYKKGNSPMSAVNEYLKNNDDFEIDFEIDNKLLISVAPRGYLKRVK
jgi:cephalosporin hydroxylase